MDIILFGLLGTLLGNLLSEYIISEIGKKKSVLVRRPNYITS